MVRDQVLELLTPDGLAFAANWIVEVVDGAPVAEQRGRLAVVVGRVDGWSVLHSAR